ncbi:peroxidase family protein [Isoptericola dokdonensis]|uniref:Heme peroxidase n=1 Tax=Isoptericola dokdonensis DS-3 TaxID=1300344 RepID=A0A161IGD0_9MICO|nr:heme peroxidase family protein [Isoptericola dokdonensis]ANC30614.1 heme peroxidase [Isoptericola dokdonensis DS-3]
MAAHDISAGQHTTASPTDAPAPDTRVDLNRSPRGRTVRRVGHGGRVEPRTTRPASPDPRTSDAPFLPDTAYCVQEDHDTGRFDATTSFDYLFRSLRVRFPGAHLPSGGAQVEADTVAALEALGTAMIEAPGPDPAGDSTVPAVYTYWGQFIDHDITLNTNGADLGALAAGDIVVEPFTVFSPGDVTAGLHNARHPSLDIDSMYGSGPRFPGEDGGPTRSETAFATADPAKLALGRLTPVPVGEPIDPGTDDQRDLPRFSEQEATAAGNAGLRRTVKIPDGRNDENLVVAQFHVALIRFHNAVVDHVRRTRPWLADDGRAVFEEARTLVRHHYQWLVLHDYLRTLTKPGVLDQVLHEHQLLFRPLRRVSMPLEFAVAAFRFGHSQIRNGYDHNKNFGAEAIVAPFASLVDLFRFTGGGGLSPDPDQPLDALPSNWPIDWSRLVDKGDPVGAHKARRIDPFLADGLRALLKEGWKEGWVEGPGGTVVDADGLTVDPELVPKDPSGDPITRRMSDMLKQLAHRNLLRGYMLAVPTGEAVAEDLGLTPLTFDQLTGRAALPAGTADGPAPARVEAMEAALEPFRGGTPLWFYVLQEAKVHGNGNFLGEVGSRILAETFVYLLRRDDDSFLRTPDPWTPADGVRLEDGSMITTLPDLLRFAGVLRQPDGSFRTEPDGTPAGHDGD